MACGSLSSAYRRSTCDNIASGIKSFYIGNFSSDTTTYSYGSTYGTSYITGGTANPNFYLVELRNGTASASEEVTANEQFGSYLIKQSIEVVLIGQSVQNRVLANKLIAGSYSVIVKNQAGQYHLFGMTSGMERGGGTANAGVQAGDENTMRITLTCQASEFAPLIDVNGTYSNTLLSIA